MHVPGKSWPPPKERNSNVMLDLSEYFTELSFTGKRIASFNIHHRVFDSVFGPVFKRQPSYFTQPNIHSQTSLQTRHTSGLVARRREEKGREEKGREEKREEKRKQEKMKERREEVLSKTDHPSPCQCRSLLGWRVHRPVARKPVNVYLGTIQSKRPCKNMFIYEYIYIHTCIYSCVQLLFICTRTCI